MTLALVTLSNEGAAVVRKLAASFPRTISFVHRSAREVEGARVFDSVLELTPRLFDQCDAIVYVLPCGVAVRAVAPCLGDKRTDPAVVVVDVAGRWSVSLLSGHEGGANRLALDVANLLDAEPVISTTTEARKTLIAGVGCRKGVDAETILAALRHAGQQAGVELAQVRLLASADVKAEEKGLHQLAERLDLPLRFISSDQIRSTCKSFEHSDFVEEKVGLPGVCEPAALLAGRRTRLLLPKTKWGPVTVALARENCSWWE